MTDYELQKAWAELHDATPPGWFVGRPAYEERRLVPWSMWAADMTERPKIGRREREWTATALTELDVVREMARCPREISEGSVPR